MTRGAAVYPATAIVRYSRDVCAASAGTSTHAQRWYGSPAYAVSTVVGRRVGESTFAGTNRTSNFRRDGGGGRSLRTRSIAAIAYARRNAVHNSVRLPLYPRRELEPMGTLALPLSGGNSCPFTRTWYAPLRSRSSAIARTGWSVNSSHSTFARESRRKRALLFTKS